MPSGSSCCFRQFAGWATGQMQGCVGEWQLDRQFVLEDRRWMHDGRTALLASGRQVAVCGAKAALWRTSGTHVAQIVEILSRLRQAAGSYACLGLFTCARWRWLAQGAAGAILQLRLPSCPTGATWPQRVKATALLYTNSAAFTALSSTNPQLHQPLSSRSPPLHPTAHSLNLQPLPTARPHNPQPPRCLTRWTRPSWCPSSPPSTPTTSRGVWQSSCAWGPPS